MSLKGDLKELEAAQHAEVLYLNRTYLRTKRELKRTLSPSRMIRKNPGAAVGIAAALGFILAPALNRTHVKVSQEAGPKRGVMGAAMGGILGRAIKMAKRFFPQMAGAPAPEPSAPGQPVEEHLPEHSPIPAMLETVIASLLGSMRIEQLVGGWVRALAEKLKSRMSGHHEGNGRHHEPQTQETGAGEPPTTGDRFDFGQG